MHFIVSIRPGIMEPSKSKTSTWHPHGALRYCTNLILVKVAPGVQVLPLLVLVNCHCIPTICPAAAVDQRVKLASVTDTVFPGAATEVERSTTLLIKGKLKQLDPPSALQPPGGLWSMGR